MKNRMVLFSLTVITSICALIGIWVQENEKQNAAEESTKNAKKADSLMENLRDTVSKYQVDLLNAYEENNRLTNKINKKAENIISEQEIALKTLLGSGFLSVIISRIEGDVLAVEVQSESKYPLFDVEVTIFDYNEIIKCDTKNIENYVVIDLKCFANNTVVEEKFNLAAGEHKYLQYSPNSNRIQNFLVFKVKSRHNTTYQYTLLEYNHVTRNLNYAYITYELVNNEQFKPLKDKSKNLTDEYWNKFFHYKKHIMTQTFE